MASGTKPKPKNKCKKCKNVSKVKIFLANPSKPKCPSLNDEDQQELQRLLIKIIEESKQSPHSFATTAHICLGLQSSLRAINNCKAACVLLSASIKPRYLLGLIARNVEVKDETVPTFIQPQLEDITQKIFGVKTLALVLPKDAKNLGVELANWISAHRKPKRTKLVSTLNAVKSVKKAKKPAAVTVPPSGELKSLNVAEETIDEHVKLEAKQWGNYISFSKDDEGMDIDEENKTEDEHKLLNVLEKMAQKAKQHSAEPKDRSPTSNTQHFIDAKDVEEPSADEDDFLSQYAPLTVHKIIPNPDRKPRKKRKKKANKNLKK